MSVIVIMAPTDTETDMMIIFTVFEIFPEETVSDEPEST